MLLNCLFNIVSSHCGKKIFYESKVALYPLGTRVFYFWMKFL